MSNLPPIDWSAHVRSEYQLRFVSKEQGYKLVNLYHLARTALAGQKPSCTPLERRIWACQQLAREDPTVTENGAYKDLCGLLGV